MEVLIRSDLNNGNDNPRLRSDTDLGFVWVAFRMPVICGYRHGKQNRKKSETSSIAIVIFGVLNIQFSPVLSEYL
jgi:hypothetical protein